MLIKPTVYLSDKLIKQESTTRNNWEKKFIPRINKLEKRNRFTK